MKKLLTLLLALGFTFAFVACENKTQTEEAEDTTEEVVEEAGEDVEEAAEEVEENVEEGAEEVTEEVDSVENAE